MLPRQGIVEIFSTFIQFNFDRFQNWATDTKLRRNIKNCLTQSSDQENSENFWVIYCHKMWQAQPQGFGKGHLSAYLQEVCYWSTQKTLSGFTTSQYNAADCFQVAISRIDKVLKGFNPNQGYSLKNYASITFSNLVRELLRQKQEVDICTDWALLRKISQKRLIESLEATALEPKALPRYVLAWNCLKIIYVPTQSNSTRQLRKPDPATWSAIAKLYNSERTGQLSNPGPEIAPDTIEIWMQQCAKSARAYLYPNVGSLNVRPGEETNELLDLLPGQDESLLSTAIVAEEEKQRSSQQEKINQVLVKAIESLDAQSKQLLELYYAQGLTQQDMAEAIGTKQYTVSRRLSKARETLLKTLVKWTSETLHISLSSDVIKNASALLEEWLAGYYRPL
jgi:RNA polymerase sigma factor (sigma-70 family)